MERRIGDVVVNGSIFGGGEVSLQSTVRRSKLAPLKIVAKNATIKASKKREIASKTTMSAHSVRHSTHGRHI